MIKYWISFSLIVAIGMSSYAISYGGETPSALVPSEKPLIIVHSHSGRTAVVADRIASLFNGRMLRYSDSYMALPSKAGESIKTEIVKLVQATSIQRVFLGFPIWGSDISKPAKSLIDKLDLKGKTVILFFTYIHYYNPEFVSRYEKYLSDKGAKLKPTLIFRFGKYRSKSFIADLTQNEILKRKDLWERKEKPRVACKPEKSAKGLMLCKVPKGAVWVSKPDLTTYNPSEQILRRENVDSFSISQAEITFASYAQCVEDNACKAINMKTSKCSDLVKDAHNLPIPCVSALAAEDYCKWAGMRLPSIAEWTRAYRGQSANYFPWGDNFPSNGTMLNDGESPETGFKEYSLAKADSGSKSDGFPGLSPPCSFPPGNSRFGVCDMAGNLTELVSYKVDGKSAYALIGGSWTDVAFEAFQVTGGTFVNEQTESYFSGFRCAK